MLNSVVSIVMVCLVPHVVLAQGAVQLPVVRQTGVATAVSVPDRGSALLGSVSRGAEGRSSSGMLLPHGPSIGREFDRSSTRVTVTVHDFEEMDRIMLQQAYAAEERVPWKNPIARFAWENEKRGRASLMGTLREHYSEPRDLTEPAETVSPAREAFVDPLPAIPLVVETPSPRQLTEHPQRDRLMDLGDRAMVRNEIGAAIGYYRAAANLGSDEAAGKIQQILKSRTR